MEMEANGVEGRRGVNLVYFLCRKGRIEHPHLLRVHHFHGNVLRLRDVKRWISDVRGDGMPDRFAWSYKRRYKGEYIWQDLMDDDLITPVSDDEYVLKGSQTSNFSHERVHTNPGSESSVSKSSIGKKASIKNKLHDMNISLRASRIHNEIEIQSSQSSTHTNNSPQHSSYRSLEDRSKPETQQTRNNKLTGYIPDKDSSTTVNKIEIHKEKNEKPSLFSYESKKNKRKVNFFRHLLKCGGSDDTESAIVPVRHLKTKEEVPERRHQGDTREPFHHIRYSRLI